MLHFCEVDGCVNNINLFLTQKTKKQNRMKKIIKTATIIIILSFTSALSNAQPPHPGGRNSGGLSPVGAPGVSPVSGGGAPINGGLTVLLVLGLIYEISKYVEHKHPKSNPSL